MRKRAEIHNKQWRRASCNSLTRTFGELKLTGAGADLNPHTTLWIWLIDWLFVWFRCKRAVLFQLKLKLSWVRLSPFSVIFISLLFIRRNHQNPITSTFVNHCVTDRELGFKLHRSSFFCPHWVRVFFWVSLLTPYVLLSLTTASELFKCPKEGGVWPTTQFCCWI